MKETTTKVESKLRVNMRLSVVEGLFAMPICFFALPGNFLTASLATQTLGLEEAIYGLIVSLPAWANVFQLFALPWLTSRLSQKTICLSFSWIHLACWTTIAWALPKLVAGNEWSHPAFIVALFGIGAFAFSVVNVSWTSWVQEWLPTKGRGKYLGRRNRLLQVGTVVFLLATSWLLGYWAENAVLGFQLIIFASVAMRAVSIVLQLRILPTKVVADERGARIGKQIRSILGNKALMRFVGFGAAFGFCANLIGPFFPVYFYKVLGMSVDEVAQLAILATTTGAISMPIWGNICDKYGCRPSLLIAMAVWMGIGYLYVFATPDRLWILYLVWAIGGTAGAGFLFGTFSMILKLIPPDAKTAAISFNLAASSLAAAIAPILGGFLYAWLNTTFDNGIAVFHWVSCIHNTITLSTALILLGVAEPKASTLTQAIGAMRPMRQIGGFLGLSFLANYSFFRKGSGDDGDEGSPSN